MNNVSAGCWRGLGNLQLIEFSFIQNPVRISRTGAKLKKALY